LKIHLSSGAGSSVVLLPQKVKRAVIMITTATLSGWLAVE
jgi:hypothetical protein